MNERTGRQSKIDAALKESRKGDSRKKLKMFLALAVVSLMIVGISAAIIHGRTTASRSAVADGDAAPQGVSASEGVTPYPSAQVKAGAPEVVLFTDMQCPVCAALEKENGEVIQQMAQSGEIALTSFPMVFLDRKFDQGDHGSSNTATNGALCAADAGRYNEFSREMFKRQPANEPDGFPASSYAEAAAAAGIPAETFSSCFDSRRYDKFVFSLDDQAAELNTKNGTPAMSINGEFISDQDMVELFSSPNTFQRVLDKYSS